MQIILSSSASPTCSPALPVLATPIHALRPRPPPPQMAAAVRSKSRASAIPSVRRSARERPRSLLVHRARPPRSSLSPRKARSPSLHLVFATPSYAATLRTSTRVSQFSYGQRWPPRIPRVLYLRCSFRPCFLLARVTALCR